MTDNGAKFYGLYNSGFVKRPFASSNRLVLSTNQKNTINSYIVDLDNGKITELTFSEGSQIVLDVYQDIILVNRRNFLLQDKLAICKLPSKDEEVPLKWIELTQNRPIKNLEGCIYDYLDLNHENDDSVSKLLKHKIFHVFFNIPRIVICQKTSLRSTWAPKHQPKNPRG